MKFAPFIPLRLTPSILRLAGTELPEILCCLGDDVFEELDLDAAQLFSWNDVSVGMHWTEPKAKTGRAMVRIVCGVVTRTSQSDIEKDDWIWFRHAWLLCSRLLTWRRIFACSPIRNRVSRKECKGVTRGKNAELLSVLDYSDDLLGENV